MTGDFRRLNEMTVPDRYPIPRIEDLVRSRYGSTVFTKLNLNKAYFQVPVAPEDVCKTAVTTPFGLYEIVGMPLGLRNATQTFQRYMDSLFRDLPYVRDYVDDVLVASASLEEHLEHLQVVLEILVKAKLSINLGKCKFAQVEVNFLRFAVNRDGFRPPQEKVEAILNYKRPTNIMGLRRFLGIINFYHTLIPNLAAIEVPLTDLMQGATKKDRTPIDWTIERTEAFEACKKGLADVMSLSFLAPEAPLMLATDASSTDLGGALNQADNNNIWHPLGFFSRKLSLTERNYSPYVRELLAVFSSLKFFSHILEGHQFVIQMDHKPLVRALLQRPEKASPRQLNQLDYISQFCVTFKYVPGKDNVVADALSRVEAVDMPTSLNAETIYEAQQEEDATAEQQLVASSLQLQELDIDGFRIRCDVSTGVVRPYIPRQLRRKAFDITHSPAHPSGRVTTRALKGKFIWPDIKSDSLRWARECIECQRAKIHRHTRIKPNNIDVPDQRFSHIHLDLIILPQVGIFRYCLTIIDRFSRWPHAVLLQNMHAETVALAFYNEWISLFGAPLTITTDQGAQFESSLFTALAQLVGASKIRTTPYHPQPNGILERWHRTLKAALMCHPQVQWTKLLPTVLLGLRSTYKEDLGASPAELLFGTTHSGPK